MGHPDISAYGGKVFRKATAWRTAYGRNRVPGVLLIQDDGVEVACRATGPRHGGVDRDLQQIHAMARNYARSHGEHQSLGICRGIACAWLIDFLHNDNATSFPAFKQLYDEVLQHQGAYFQEQEVIDDVGKDPSPTIERYERACQVKNTVHLINHKETNRLTGDNFAQESRWSAYVSLGRHAVGVGRWDEDWADAEQFYIMDPNLGLFGYKTAHDCAEDLTDLYTLYKTFKRHNKNLRVYFYKLGEPR